MGKFRDLFKVRRPGNGDTFQKSVQAASKKSQAEVFPLKDNSALSGGKTEIKR